MKGSCLCGTVQFTVEGTPAGTNYCHCRQCRKASGSAFATNAGFKVDGFRIVSGQDALSAYESSPGKLRHFCGHCGSPIFSSSRNSPDTLYVRIGTLDDVPGPRPDVHIHVASKADWFEILDELPQLEREEGLWF